MKHFLLHQFELSTHIVIFGRPWAFRRAARILFPLFVYAAIIIVNNPLTYDFQLWQLAGYIPLAVGIYFGFIHYSIFGYDYEDLDFEQKYFYLSGKRKGAIAPYRITPEQLADLDNLTYEVQDYYASSSWNRVKNLIPLIIGLLGIAGWFTYWTLTL